MGNGKPSPWLKQHCSSCVYFVKWVPSAENKLWYFITGVKNGMCRIGKSKWGGTETFHNNPACEYYRKADRLTTEQQQDVNRRKRAQKAQEKAEVLAKLPWERGK